ncbi:MAG TPA: OmpA family protein [Phycisphaerales bacterium]|nr:OmpA family protein [Phycisphaerales bacterium]HMP36557.1 OmpA family protein [Phycisphaerales bacterium]
MRFRPLLLPLVVAGVALLCGCDQKSKDETALLTTENSALRDELNERNRALEASENERRNLAIRLSEAERMAQSGGGAAAPSGARTGSTGFEGIMDADVTVIGGQVTVAVEGDVLFDSGRATLKPAAKRSLDQIASVLNSRYAGQPIIIEGHTDTDPIRRSGFKSNFHLGFERAWAVSEYLVSRGVALSRMTIASAGPNEPRGTKAQSRRVEVIVGTQ